MKTIDRLTQTQLQYQDKQKIIEGVSMKCFCVFSYRRVYGLFYICQYWMTLDGHGVKGHLMPSSYPEPSLITLDKKI